MIGPNRREGVGWLLAAIAAGVLVLSIALSLAVALHPAPLPGDIAIAKRVQAAPLLDGIATVTNPLSGVPQWLAIGLGLALVIPGLRVGGGRAGSQLRREALWAIGAVIALRFAVEPLKDIVGSARPTAANGIRILEVRDTFGFPSGHVYGDVLVYGVLSVYARAFFSRRLVEPFRMGVAIVIVAAGPSRLVVGAHWPVDVLGGYMWGATGLLVSLSIARWGGRRRWLRHGGHPLLSHTQNSSRLPDADDAGDTRSPDAVADA